MHDRDRIKKIAEELNIPAERWVLGGSGVMVMHGIERKMRDVDIFTSTATWFGLFGTGDWDVFVTDPDDPQRRCDPPYLYRVMHDIEVNIFFNWRRRGRGDIDVAFWVHNTEMIDGIPCLPLQFLLDWKMEVGRAKDIDDISALKEFLAVA
jgi:hypothetical protein